MALRPCDPATPALHLPAVGAGSGPGEGLACHSLQGPVQPLPTCQPLLTGSDAANLSISPRVQRHVTQHAAATTVTAGGCPSLTGKLISSPPGRARVPEATGKSSRSPCGPGHSSLEPPPVRVLQRHWPPPSPEPQSPAPTPTARAARPGPGGAHPLPQGQRGPGRHVQRPPSLPGLYPPQEAAQSQPVTTDRRGGAMGATPETLAFLTKSPHDRFASPA